LAYPLGSLKLTNMGDKVKYIQFLHDASEIRFKPSEDTPNDLILNLPVQKPDVVIPVLEVFLK
jgi:alpha-L-fucosidase